MTMPSDDVVSKEELDLINARLQEEYLHRLGEGKDGPDPLDDDPPLTAQERRLERFLEEGRDL